MRASALPPRHCEPTGRANARPMARNDGSGAGGQAHAWLAAALPRAAWAAARRAIGTREGEEETESNPISREKATGAGLTPGAPAKPSLMVWGGFSPGTTA